MREDDLLREVRAAREEYCRQFDYDLGAIVHDLREQERVGGRRVVSLPPRRPARFRGEVAEADDRNHTGPPEELPDSSA